MCLVEAAESTAALVVSVQVVGAPLAKSYHLNLGFLFYFHHCRLQQIILPYLSGNISNMHMSIEMKTSGFMSDI